MSIDAMKQALEYTRPGAIVPVTPETVKILVDALRLAVEQAELQEPVAWEPKIETQYQDGFVVSQRIKRTPDGPWEDYTAPPQRQPLQGDKEGWYWVSPSHCISIDMIRTVEKLHGIGGEHD